MALGCHGRSRKTRRLAVASSDLRAMAMSLVVDGWAVGLACSTMHTAVFCVPVGQYDV